jgi:threonine aldolase
MKRKIMGGGMRQAGILAAGGIIALTKQPAHLARDHARAKALAEKLKAIPGIQIRPEEVDINMVFFKFEGAGNQKNLARIMGVFEKHHIRINPPEGGLFRFVTHYWIGDAEIDAIVKASAEAFGS